MTNGTTSSSGGGGLVIVLVLVVLIVAGGLGYWFFGRKLICNMKGATSNVATWKYDDTLGCIAKTCTTPWMIPYDGRGGCFKGDCSDLQTSTSTPTSLDATYVKSWSKDNKTGACIATCTDGDINLRDNRYCEPVFTSADNNKYTQQLGQYNATCRGKNTDNGNWPDEFKAFTPSDTDTKFTFTDCMKKCDTEGTGCNGIAFMQDTKASVAITKDNNNNTTLMGKCWKYTGIPTDLVVTPMGDNSCWAKIKK